MTGVTFATSDAVDFLVIGAGAAGGVVAKELATAGFSVIVLEQGPYLGEKDFSHDEVKYKFTAGLTNDTKIQPILYRKSEHEQARPMKALEYGRQVGGGTVHFTSNYWRFHESDFHERSAFGEVSGADLADWPISYAELEPYYTKAEYDLGISGWQARIRLRRPVRNRIRCRQCRRSRRACCSRGPRRSSDCILFRRPWRSFRSRTAAGPRV